MKDKISLTNEMAVQILEKQSPDHELIEDTIVSMDRHCEKRWAVIMYEGRYWGGYYLWEDADWFKFDQFNDGMELEEVRPVQITIYV